MLATRISLTRLAALSPLLESFRPPGGARSDLSLAPQRLPTRSHPILDALQLLKGGLKALGKAGSACVIVRAISYAPRHQSQRCACAGASSSIWIAEENATSRSLCMPHARAMSTRMRRPQRYGEHLQRGFAPLNRSMLLSAFIVSLSADLCSADWTAPRRAGRCGASHRFMSKSR